MKNYSKIFIFIFGLIALCGCEQKTLTQGGVDDEEDFTIPSGSYIFFNVDNPTRAALKVGQLTEPFYVLGYKYTSADGWKAAKAQASQNKLIDDFTDYKGAIITDARMGVFGLDDRYSEGYDPDTSDNSPDKQLVEYEYSNGVHLHKYSPLQEWEPNLTYSFFAWYPTNLEFNTGATKSDGSPIAPVDFEGNPYITYNLPQGEGARAAMADVMTACKIDAKKRHGVNVNLTMEHRLSVLDIQAVNIISAVDIEEIWNNEVKVTTEGFTPNGGDLATLINGISEDDKVTVTINSLTLNLSKLYRKATISLNTDEETCDYKKDANGDFVLDANGQQIKETIIVSDPVENVDFPFVYGSVANAENDGKIAYYYDLTAAEDAKVKQLVNSDKKLILIPQNEPITATLTVEYTIECNGVSKTYKIPRTELGDASDVSDDVEIKAEATIAKLEEGCHHYLELTFSKNGLFVVAKSHETWEDFTIRHDFE